MKKCLLIALTAMLLPFLATAQSSISGKITEKDSGQPLAGASVSINGRFARHANAEGMYSFKNLKPGDYTIRVSFIGYVTLEKTVQLKGDLTFDLVMKPGSYLTDEVVVKATRASENSATTYRNIRKQELEKNNHGRDLPYLLNQTPSVVVTSDAGAGIGYSGIRIRGSDPTRINVTINGIPYNDPESHGTFWVNLPDFASSVDNIQIQRGVGTSTNGAGAFGGSLNIQTATRRDSAYAELNNSYGSFDTWKNTLSAGTGLINNRFSFDGRLSRIKSDGYIDRGFSDLKSFFLSGAYYGKNNLLRANVFSGSEKTYQAWNGVPQSMLETNRTFNGFTYDDQTDNYTQDHYQLLYSHAVAPALTFNGALHYTKGRGYYEEFKEGSDLANYGIQPVIIGGETIAESDLVRRRWLDNAFYGATYSLDYRPSNMLNLTLGGGYNEYDGDHFGEVIWAEYASDSNIRQRYYDGNGFKTDFNVFGKAEFQAGNFNFFADLQYRRLGYTITGTDKNRNSLDVSDRLNFFNPKFGLTYRLDQENSLYASFATGSKEPNRDDYINSTANTRPKPETLKNIEIGYRTSGKHFDGGINGFAMLYKDQLILTGKINDVGEYIRQNVPDSYRLGLEFDTRWHFTNNLSWGATASVSRNKIEHFTEYIDDYDNGGQLVNNYRNTDIAFSPSFVGSSELSFRPTRKTEIALLSKYVSDQYMDNTSNGNRKIDAFFVNDLRLRYNTPFKKVKNIGVTLLVNNIFNELYESNGYTFSYMYGGSFTTENFYFPQATTNFLLALSMKF
ncbi:MAG TPA: TonB-dependent receptor [Sphingobacteriaceae bacterium]